MAENIKFTSASELEPMNTDQFASRLRLAIGDESLNGFGQKCGINESTLRRYLNGSVPSLDKAMQIANVANVSLQWLATGKGNMNVKVLNTNLKRDEFVYMDRYNVDAAAGHGSLNEFEKVDKQFAFRRQWFENKGINESEAIIICAKGESMEPTIKNNDLLMLDTSKKQFIENSIYVIRVNDLLMVKRIQPTFKGFNFISDNKEYEKIEITYNEADDLQVIGKVVWVGKELD